MPDLPTGTVTFLFTDVEGSTKLLQQIGDRYRGVLADYRRILGGCIDDAGRGVVVDLEGDGVFAVFPSAADAVIAAVEAQRALARQAWPEGAELRVRMGVHTGEASLGPEGYVGLDVHRAARIASAAHGGQVVISASTLALVEHSLPEGVTVRDLGSHRLKDLAHAEQIAQVVVPGLPNSFGPLRSLDVVGHDLPIQLTSFVGRERELAELDDLLSSARLVTLIGPGGSGKTRLALEGASHGTDRYRDGAWFVDLAPLTSPDQVPLAVAGRLGVSGRSGRPTEAALVDYLADRELQLVLDNCEHLVDKVSQLVAGLLQAAPQLRVLATSREPLGVSGETTYEVRPLPFPDVEDGPDIEAFDAVRLFVEPARSAEPRFELTEANARAVAQICRRLDGMPLALELAAARTKMLPVDQIAVRLDDRFRLLTDRSRTAVPRQQTLLATVEWSYELLSEGERLLFDRLAVFRGGFTVEAAEAVCGGDDLDESEVLDLLTQLVDKSLVVTAGRAWGTGRFRMLETLRQFSAERLAAGQETDQVRGRHAAYFLSLAEQAEPLLETSVMAEWLDRLETDHDNLRAALGWMLDAGETIDALRMTVALSGWFWLVHSHSEEAYGWHEQTLAAADNAPADLLASAYAKASTHATNLGRFARATELANKAIRLATATGNLRAQIIAHFTHSQVAAAESHDLVAEVEQAKEALRLAEAAKDDIWISRSAQWIGHRLLDLGQPDDAAAYVNRALEAARRVDWPMGIGHAAWPGSGLAISAGDLDRAFELVSEFLTVAKSLDDAEDIAAGHGRLALLARMQGDPEQGRELAQEGLGLVSRRTPRVRHARLLAELAANALATGRLEEATDATLNALALIQGSIYKHSKGRVLSRAANILISQRVIERAITLYAVVERLYDESREPDRWNKIEAERDLVEARDRIGAQDFTAAWKTGRSLDPDDATDKAVAWLQELKTETA